MVVESEQRPGVEDLARDLERAEALNRPIPLFTERIPRFDAVTARAVARARDGLRVRAGDRRVGWKLGWTSAAMREALGVDRPNWGSLWESQRVEGALDPRLMIHPKVEPELVFRARSDLWGRVEPEEVRGEWALGLEVVDPRFPDYEFDWLDNTADNSSAAAVVTGPFSELAVDPAEVEVVFTDGGSERRGLGAAAMGSPREAVAWLVRSLAGEGEGLMEGEIVYTGGLAAPFDVECGHTYEVRSAELGRVVLAAGS